jgi:ABC-type branched-subunit amino acid transport system substrate-binding protein
MLFLLFPLSGPNAGTGQQLWDAAVLALFDSGRDDVILVPQDTQGTPTGALAAANAAVKGGANAVIGPLFSSSVKAAKPILAAHGIRGITLSNNRAVAGMPFYVIGNDPEPQVDALVSYLASSGRHRIALLGPDTAYLRLLRERLALHNKIGKVKVIDSVLYRNEASYTEISNEVRAITSYKRRSAALTAFTTAFSDQWRTYKGSENAFQHAFETPRPEKAGLTSGTIGDHNSSALSQADYQDARSQLRQIYDNRLRAQKTSQVAMSEAIAEFELRETLGQVDFDAVLLPVSGTQLMMIAPMFEYFNASQPDVWLVGTEIWEPIIRESSRDLLGARYVTGSSHYSKDFQSRFKTSFGYTPEPLASKAYDAVRVAIVEKQETGRISLAEKFVTRGSGFEGVNGRFWFRPNGISHRKLEVVELRANGPEPAFVWDPDWREDERLSPASVNRDKIAPVRAAPEPTNVLQPVSSAQNLPKVRG